MRLLFIGLLLGTLLADGQSTTTRLTRLDPSQVSSDIALTDSGNVFSQPQSFAAGITLGSSNNWSVATDSSGNFVIQNGTMHPIAIAGTTGWVALANPQIVNGNAQLSCGASNEGMISYLAGSTNTNGSFQVCQNQSGTFSWIGNITAAQAGAASPVQSVAGRSGNIVLTHSDITDWATATSGFTSGSPATLSSDASIVNLGAQYSVGGLINVLAYSGGIAINDGTIHTVGNAPAGSPFYGVTTLAGLAAISINGSHPFSWITVQSSPFSFSGDAYNLTDAKVSKIDIAWLAIQAGLLNGKLYTPAGTYVIGSSLPLTLFIPAHSEASGQYQGGIFWNGDGPRNTLIKAGYDWGTGYALVSCGDPQSTPGSATGRYTGENYSGDIKNVGFVSSAPQVIFSPGVVGINMDGMAWGSRLRLMDVEASGFFHDLNIVGDHTEFIRLHVYGGVFGLYLPPSGPNFGDLAFSDFRAENQSIAAIGVSNSATLSATMEGQTYLQAPYGIYGQADTNGSCADIANRLDIHHLMAEYMGNALFQDDTGFSSGSYNDAAKCRSITKTQIGDLFVSWGSQEYWNSGGRQRRAAIDLGSLGLLVSDLECDAGCWTPNDPNYGGGSGSTPVATINVNSLNAVRGVLIRGDIQRWIANSGTLPLIGPSLADAYGALRLQDAQGWSGYVARCSFANGNHSVSAVGDLIEPYYAGCAVGGTNLNTPVLGVAMQAGQTQYLPIANAGIVPVNTGAISLTASLLKKATGVGGALQIVPGAGGANGSYAWTATGGGCSTAPAGTFIVSAGTISAATITNQGAGCTGVPSISVSAASGLTGASITPTWPSGVATTANGYSDGPFIGAFHFGGGSSPNFQANVQLLGLQ